jgi:hypothetical protein
LPNNNGHLGEARRLTAAWLNIMAAGLVSAGLIPVLTAFAVEGWSERARSLALLPAFALSAGTALHMIGRLILRQKQSAKTGPSLRMLSPPLPEQTPGRETGQDQELDFPTERDIDDVLEEFGQDSRAAIGALLHDLNTLASDQGISILRGFVSGPSELARAKPDECRR